jgi:hypothetical protein
MYQKRKGMIKTDEMETRPRAAVSTFLAITSTRFNRLATQLVPVLTPTSFERDQVLYWSLQDMALQTDNIG